MHQRRTRPETMPAQTQKHGEPKTNTQIDKRRHTQTQRVIDKHTDRQMSADNTALGLRAP